MRLSFLIFCCLHGTCWTSEYCVHQPKTLSVKEGGSVTLPCSYTYPEDPREKSRIIVTWGERDGSHCTSIKKYITDGSGNIMAEYKDWISIEKHPDNNRTESLLIRGVKASDRITICCRVTERTTSGTKYTWNDLFGTSIMIADEGRLSQMEELMAVAGEEIIIPCHYPVKILGEAQKVSWYTGDYNGCYFFEEKKIFTWERQQTYDRYSLVNFPGDVSLRIRHILGAEYPRFCCRVTTSNGTMENRFGTEVTIAGSPFSSSAPFNVTQPEGITGHEGESVTLNCSYSRYMESDVVGVNIYWRLGNISGPYVYHPYNEMVHPRYKGRTEITGAADLHIRGLQTSDDSMYYCFVMIRLCVGIYKYPKQVQYGEGTRLIVTELQNDLGKYQLVIIISISAGLLVVLLCVILGILKKRGVICKKKNVSDEKVTSDNPGNEELSLEERPYCEISTKNTKRDDTAESKKDEKEKMMEKQTDEQENIVYSEVNQTKQQERNPTSHQTQKEQVVYATVIKPHTRK